ncbi:MAG: hypothetical protein HND46_02700 [Chloroflexi bacterium]|nr:hypothetical protein [Chloroflexota bacterium]NOG62306.1 hypothetical protein [Chloroflexota bacterium]
MDNEFAGSVSPEMTQVKAAAKAFFDSMELYIGAIQQLEDEMKRLQGEIDDPHQEGPQQQDGNLDAICEDLDPIECLQGLNIELITEGSATWTDEQIQVVYDSIKAQYNAIAQAGGSFESFFPHIILVMSDQGAGTGYGALTEEEVNSLGGNLIAGQIQITFWNNGMNTFPSNPDNPLFSVELVTHEFGHALNYGRGQNLLSRLFDTVYSGHPAAINSGTNPVWDDFERGSLRLNEFGEKDYTTYGRLYASGSSLNPDEIFAEAYSVWVHDYYVKENLDTADLSTGRSVSNLIELQKIFWEGIFSGEILLDEIDYSSISETKQPDEYYRRLENYNRAVEIARSLLISDDSQ